MDSLPFPLVKPTSRLLIRTATSALQRPGNSNANRYLRANTIKTWQRCAVSDYVPHAAFMSQLHATFGTASSSTLAMVSPGVARGVLQVLSKFPTACCTSSNSTNSLTATSGSVTDITPMTMDCVNGVLERLHAAATGGAAARRSGSTTASSESGEDALSAAGLIPHFSVPEGGSRAPLSCSSVLLTIACALPHSPDSIGEASTTEGAEGGVQHAAALRADICRSLSVFVQRAAQSQPSLSNHPALLHLSNRLLLHADTSYSTFDATGGAGSQSDRRPQGPTRGGMLSPSDLGDSPSEVAHLLENILRNPAATRLIFSSFPGSDDSCVDVAAAVAAIAKSLTTNEAAQSSRNSFTALCAILILCERERVWDAVDAETWDKVLGTLGLGAAAQMPSKHDQVSDITGAADERVMPIAGGCNDGSIFSVVYESALVFPAMMAVLSPHASLVVQERLLRCVGSDLFLLATQLHALNTLPTLQAELQKARRLISPHTSYEREANGYQEGQLLSNDAKSVASLGFTVEQRVVLCQLLDDAFRDALDRSRAAMATPQPLSSTSFAPLNAQFHVGHLEAYLAVRCLLHVPGSPHCMLSGAPSDALEVLRSSSQIRSAPGSRLAQSVAAFSMALSCANASDETLWASSALSALFGGRDGGRSLEDVFAPILLGDAPLDARSATCLLHSHPFLLQQQEGIIDGLMQKHIGPAFFPANEDDDDARRRLGSFPPYQWSGFLREQLVDIRLSSLVAKANNDQSMPLFTAGLQRYLKKHTPLSSGIPNLDATSDEMSLLSGWIAALPRRF